jgi:UDP:flavonoid glycosyltransferase YjiC (YdhE family)
VTAVLDILFLTADGGGNVPPALALARELAERGHGVRFLGHPAQESEIHSAGHGFRPYRHALLWSGHEPRSSTRAAVDFLRFVTDRGCRADLDAELSRRRADVVVIDAMMPAAAVAAARRGVPYALLMHTFARFFLGLGRFEALGRLRGVSIRNAWSRAPLALVTSDRALDPAPPTTPASFVWSGVVEQAPRTATRPVIPPQVLVSLSSVDIPGQDALLQRILDALAPLPVRVVATTGPTMDPASLRPPPNAEVHAFVPHYDVMPSSSLVIGHGGHSTTMRALLHDLPLLILPADPRIDHPMLGRAVETAGAGRMLPKSVPVPVLRAVVQELLGDPGFRSAAAGVGARLREARGPQRAADLVAALAAPRGA